MPFPLFAALAVELQQNVMQQCERPELLKIALCSRDMNRLAISIIYRHVDLSYHNDEGLFSAIPYEKMVRGDNPDRRVGVLKETMFHAQELFIDTIIQHPSFGAYVSSLVWTYLWVIDELDINPQRLWKAFQSLTNVKTIDICSMDLEEQYVVPPPLFPSATKIRVGDRIPYALFRAILAFPAQLTSLEIDNVHGLGQVSDGMKLYYSDTLYEAQETEDDDLVPVTRHDGPMKGHLNLLVGKCTKLRYLCIKTVGQDNYPDTRWCEKREQERYEEVARFIDSVKLTLESLNLEYGTEPDQPFRMPCRGLLHAVPHVGRPMDRRFFQYILPALCRGKWPALKVIAILGIGGTPTKYALRNRYTPEDRSVFDNAEEKLRVAFGNNITLIWQRENASSFYLLEHRGLAYITTTSL